MHGGHEIWLADAHRPVAAPGLVLALLALGRSWCAQLIGIVGTILVFGIVGIGVAWHSMIAMAGSLTSPMTCVVSWHRSRVAMYVCMAR